jgi:hypothetical protein
MNIISKRIAASSSNVPQNNLSSRSRFSGRGISFSQQELIKKMFIKMSFEGGVAGPLFNYDTYFDTGRGG